MSRHPVVLVCAGAAASWGTRVRTWAGSDSVPLAITFCPSVDHLRARLRASPSRRTVLLDGDLPDVDRDLLADITAAAGVAVIVEGTRRRLAWQRLGAAGVLTADFDQTQLVSAITPSAALPVARETPAAGPLIAVTGPGGTGASVTAIALAQGLAAAAGRVLLCDCCLHAEQAMLHNAHGGHPGLADVIEMHAEYRPTVRQVRQLALGIVERGYHLMLGLRRARHWSSVRSASLYAALTSLRTAFDVVIADVDADVDGELQTGSAEIEERNVIARAVFARADVTLVVGQPSMKGVYALVRTVTDLLEFGVAPQHVLPVLNQSTGGPGERAALARAVRHLIDGAEGGPQVGPVLFLPAVALEAHLRDCEALPEPLSRTLAEATQALLGRHGVRQTAPAPALQRVAPGALGHWGGADP